MPTEKELRDLRTRFEMIRPRYQGLVDEMIFALKKELGERDVTGAEVVGRAKETESFLEKCQRKEYEDPLAQVTDLAGVRVVCQFTVDVNKASALVDELFTVREKVDKTDELGTDKMGYQGVHYIVELGDRYSGARYDELKDLCAEIQIRTILQDAWAHISHSLAYKSEASIPRAELRELNRVASLLEIAQNIFDRSSTTRREYSAKVASVQGTDAFLEQPIDRETVSAYTQWKYPNLPIKHEVQELLIRDLDHSRYRTLSDIDRAVSAARKAVEAYQKEAPQLFQAGTDYITKSLGFVDQLFREKHGFARRTRHAFEKFSHLVSGHTRDDA
jgi:putative GTP pyrophosphokinase